MFKIKNDISKNPKEKLLIIKKIINLQRQRQRQRGGAIELSSNSKEQLQNLSDKLYGNPLSKPVIDYSSNIENVDINKEIVNVLNKLQEGIANTDKEKVYVSLEDLYRLLDTNDLEYSEQYKGIIQNVVKDVKEKELSVDLKDKINKLTEDMIQEPALVNEQSYYKKLYMTTTNQDTLQSMSSLPTMDKKPTTEPILPLEQKDTTVNETYLSDTEQNLVYMLLQLVGFKNLNTWEKISKKYKILYNIIVKGEDDTDDINKSLCKYSYSDIDFVQNIINFNHYGLIDWETATANIKIYINDLLSLVKGEHTDTINDTESIEKPLSIMSNDNDNDNDNENDNENENENENDSENDSEEDIEKYDRS